MISPLGAGRAFGQRLGKLLELASVFRHSGIEILWKDGEAAQRAVAAFEKYQTLSQEERKVLGQRMLDPVAAHLRDVVRSAIADAQENPVVGVWVDIFFRRGEIGHHEFRNIEDALDYLQSWSESN